MVPTISGAISICFELAIDPALPIARLTELADLVYESDELTARGRAEMVALLPRLGPALIGAHPWAGFETYTVLLAQTCALFSQNIWTDIAEKAIPVPQKAVRQIVPRAYRTVRLDLNQIQPQGAGRPGKVQARG